MCVFRPHGARVRDRNLVWEALHGRQALYREGGPMLAIDTGFTPSYALKIARSKPRAEGHTHGMI